MERPCGRANGAPAQSCCPDGPFARRLAGRVARADLNTGAPTYVTPGVTARRSSAALGAASLVLAAVLAVLTAGPAAAHGAPVSPTSRAAACGSQGTQSGTAACRAALAVSPAVATQWDNIRVPDVAGRDRQVIPDGKLCSGGLAKFAGLDLPRADWPATRLTAGAEHTFSYEGTIPHEGTFRLYATRQGYLADQRLTWADLEPTPFVSVTDPTLSDGSYTFEGTLPDGLSGRHMIYTIWETSSTPDTYYSCSDVVFEGAGSTRAGAAERAAGAEDEAGAGDAAGAAPAGASDPATAATATTSTATTSTTSSTAAPPVENPVDLQATVRAGAGGAVLLAGAAAVLALGAVAATVLRRRRPTGRHSGGTGGGGR